MAPSPTRKIVAPAELAATLAEQRDAGRSVIQCHGCFDIVHPGHVRYLQFARSLGDVLVVSLTADAGVGKGDTRPYIPQDLRAENLAALEFVDWVVVDDHPTAVELLALLRPDYYVKGHEYAHATDPRFLRERETVESYGGRVVFHSGDVVFSSTRLIDTIESSPQLEACRLRATCLRSGITAATISACMDRISKLRVLVIGDLISERYILCDATEAARQAPVMSLRQLGVQQYWGGAAAVALQAQALGAQPILLSAVGGDGPSQAIRDALRDSGVITHLLTDRPDLIRRNTYVADDNKLFEVTEGVFAPLDSTAERRAQEVLSAYLPQVDAVLWCEHGFGMATPGLVQAVADHARRREYVVAGHAPSTRGQLLGLMQTDLLTATERDVRAATQDMSSGLSSATWRLLSKTRGQTALVSMHKRGLVGFDGRRSDGGALTQGPDRLKSDFVPALTKHHVDLAGADEAVLTAGALTLAVGGSLPLATYLAAAVEAAAVQRGGAEQVSTDALHALLTTRREVWPESRFVADGSGSYAPSANALSEPGSRFVAQDEPANTPQPRTNPLVAAVATPGERPTA